MALTAKKMQFAKALIAGKSNKDAALAAGYGVATASAAGSRLAKDPDVKEHLNKLRREANPEFAKAKADVRKATAALLATVDAVLEVLEVFEKVIKEAGVNG